MAIINTYSLEKWGAGGGRTFLILHKWILAAWDKFPVTASCMIQKELWLKQLR